MKRKRHRGGVTEVVKRTGICKDTTEGNHQSTPSVLRLYYPQVLTLREYLSQATTSKNKKRQILNYGSNTVDISQEANLDLAKLLDIVLVGCHDVKQEEHDLVDYQNDLSIFSTQVSGSTARSTGSQVPLAFSEIVEFAIWQLFRKHTSGHRPPHVLCHGYYHDGLGAVRASAKANAEDDCEPLSHNRNEHVNRLKGEDWAGLPTLVGTRGTIAIVKLLQDCGMYMPLEGGKNNHMQISGVDLSELRSLDKHNPAGGPKQNGGAVSAVSNVNKDKIPQRREANTLNTIRFVRHRILYRKPDLNAKNGAYFGLPHIHILNRVQHVEDENKNAHLLKYVFPRQFGLHNVFTYEVDLKNSAQPFKDYTLREQEIESANKRPKHRSLPKRLRGECETLIGQLSNRHARCAYSALLHYYCPDTFTREHSEITEGRSILQIATSSSQVSAFCRSAVAKVFPGRFWGHGEAGATNKAHVMQQIDRFVKLGRYESLMLHEVAQDIKISKIAWLRPPHETESSKMSASDFRKRKEILAELLYYLFDSFLIPLISSNFYVTESSTFRNRLLYFRHDVWQKLSEPALNKLKLSMFDEVGKGRMEKTLSDMSIGTGRVRLLPKESGLRPIINLKRRVQAKKNGRLVLGKSVNKILEPAFRVLNLEKVRLTSTAME
ncbi:hypothetical protein E4T38_05761 [Aureobasidium subglaciale]|nr:hypothetical protein E4T38_05761 [Aureobasidium subglaciale]KAI5221121.1 hypothetical protein E4T40_05603 [Aureobasidium subglaciale]KAI5224354.1 hypothetical protein E4T41_05740 [Aureobasidium subglaciale]KAI5260998.1 hypothetical protein E4T46_05515 [Aureobasidium subglaciale]